MFVQERPLSTCITGLMSSGAEVMAVTEFSPMGEPETNQNTNEKGFTKRACVN